MFAVRVVGGGLIGSYVARELARRGWSVLLLDPLEEPDPVCTGLVSSKAVREHKLDEFTVWRIDGARFHADGETAEVFREGVAYVLDRKELDKAVREDALSEGAEFEKAWVTPSRLRRGEALITVGADGPASTVRGFMGVKEPELFKAAQTEVKGEFDHIVDVYLDAAPDFFGWVVPKSENRAIVGVATAGNPVLLLRGLLRRIRKKASNIRGGLIPVEPLKDVKRETFYLVGDAAAQVKPTTGGGIYYGLLAAKVLVDSIHGRLTGRSDVYERYHRTKIYPKLAFLAILRRLYPKLCWERVLRDAKEFGILEELEKRGDMEDPSFLLYPRFIHFIFRIASPYLQILRRPF